MSRHQGWTNCGTLHEGEAGLTIRWGADETQPSSTTFIPWSSVLRYDYRDLQAATDENHGEAAQATKGKVF